MSTDTVGNNNNGNAASGGGPAAAAVVLDTPQTLNTREQQAVMAGLGGGVGFGLPSTATASPAATTHKGLKAAVLALAENASQEVYTDECNLQHGILDNYNTTEAARVWATLSSPFESLRVMAVMKPGSPLILPLWALGKCAAIDPNNDVSKGVLACAGDRTKWGDAPTVVSLPAENSWKWKTVKANWDDRASFAAFYGLDENRTEFLEIPTANDTTEKQFPRMLYLPFELGAFVSDPHTPYELDQECERLKTVDGCKIPDEFLEWVQSWCKCAMYKHENGSVLQLKTDPVTSTTDAFLSWRHKLVNWHLGEVTTPPAATSTATSPSNAQGGGGLDAMEQRLERMAETILTAAASKTLDLAKQLSDQSPTSGGIGANPTKGTKILEGEELYAVMTWCNVMQLSHVPAIWRTMFSSVSKLQKRSEIQKKMNKWSVKNQKPINQLIRLDKLFFDDLVDINPSASEARASWMNIGRGMSAQWALPVSNEYIGRMDALERAADETKHTRTIETQIRLAKAEPRKPPETLDELKRGVGTFAALIHLFYGEHCDHYKKCWTMLEVLYSPQVYFAEQAYTPEMIKSYWFEVLDSGRGFFFTALGEEEFQRPGGPAFPGSMLNTVLPYIKSTTKVENGLFPIKWMGTSTQTKTTPGSSGGGAALPPPPSFTPPKPDGNPPPFNNITSHCHPIIGRVP